MSGACRRWIHSERNRLVRAQLEAAGYVLDYWLVYRLEFPTRLAVAQAAPASRPTMLRAAARGSSRRLHAERMARSHG